MIHQEQRRWLTCLENGGVLRQGHFKVRHGDGHALVFFDWKATQYGAQLWCVKPIYEWMQQQIGLNELCDTLVGVANGGNLVAQMIPHARSSAEWAFRIPELAVVPTAKAGNGKFSIDCRHHRFIAEKRVVVVEDVVTSGESLRAVIQTVRELGGDVTSAATVINRGQITARDLGVSWLASGIDCPFLTFKPGVMCPGCRSGAPLVEI